MLSKTEIEMLISNLETLSDYQSNAGCNDCEIKNTPENVIFIQSIISQSDYPDDEIQLIENDSKILFSDFSITEYLKKRLKSLI